MTQQRIGRYQVLEEIASGGQAMGNQLTINMQAAYAGVPFEVTFIGTASPDGRTLSGEYFIPATGEIGVWEVTRAG